MASVYPFVFRTPINTDANISISIHVFNQTILSRFSYITGIMPHGVYAPLCASNESLTESICIAILVAVEC